MNRKFVSTLIAGAVLVAPAALAAPRGKPGLWNISTTLQAAAMPEMPPEVRAMMKQRGLNLPGLGKPIVSQVCTTAEQAAMDRPPNMDREGVKCTPRVLSQTATSATTEITCHGKMEGVGRSQISWRGDSHYEGSYSFKGTMDGHASNISSSYVGDWVKADCGSVKPFTGKIPTGPRPPAPK